nr:dna topoisomerase 2-associated protein pat1 [Quercus suber]
MSFFGFDATLPRDRAVPSSSRGMFEAHDPFAGLSRDEQDGSEILNFDDTYDGLGRHLDESGDTFNDDTFGGGEPVTRQSVGRDFDFAGQTAQVRDTLLEEQALHHARQPMSQTQAARPAKTGYEAYKRSDYIPKLEADASIWGTPIVPKPADQPAKHEGSAARKMMSLEEVEAMMRAQSKPTPTSSMPDPSQGLRAMLGVESPAMAEQNQQRPPQILQRPQPQPSPFPQDPAHGRQTSDYNLRAPQILQRQQSQPSHSISENFHDRPSSRPFSQDFHGQASSQSMQYQQQTQMPRGPAPPVQAPRGPQHQQHISHIRGPSYNGPPITQAQQMMTMSDQDREAYVAEEAKRAKRNHKIFLLSKNNGMMTPQDKNFITRIQLQQLLTATGGIDNEPGSEQQLAEDFYYQVYAQIRGGPPRTGPGQPLNKFAQTYLFQTGSRYGYGRSRHHPRGGDNHVQRMEQQVARAVEAAKARPKNKQLVVEGSLGKIAFSNSKTPRPLLNLKRADSATQKHPQRPLTGADRKAALRDIENMYSTLMKLEDHERKLPPPPHEESPPEVIEGHMRWRSEMQLLNQQLWESLKILSHAKGKKAIPRVFRHLDEQQRLTMLTLTMIHLDILDVIRDAYPPMDNSPLPPRVKEEVELFSQAIIPPLFSFVNEAPLNIIIGMLGLVLDRVHVQSIVRTKIGVSMLTMLISRAELIRQSVVSPQQPQEWNEWVELYNRLFDTIEPVLPYIFPMDTNISASDDVHVWQFLAAMGVGASQDQQQRLVVGVKDRVMETVAVSKTLPDEMGGRRLADVNLFMRAIGLDVGLLD